MKKKYLFLGIIVFILTLTVGCTLNKSAISTEDFKEKATNKGYETIDISDQYKDYIQIMEATAINKEDFQVEFYVLTVNSNAQKMFERYKEIFEDNKEGMSMDTTESMINYTSYTLETGGKYKHLCQVENTLLYVDVDEGYKDKAKELIDELGY